MKVFILILSFLIHFPLLANNTDSLSTHLDELAEEEQVDLLLQRSSEIAKSDPRQAFKYGELALAKAQRINYQKGIANSYNTMGNLLNVKGAFSKSDSLVTLAMNIYGLMNDEEGRATCHLILGKTLYRNGNPAKALRYFDKSLTVFKDLDKPNALAKLYINFGNAYWYMNHLDSSKIYYEKSLVLATKHGLRGMHSKALSNLALISEDLGEYVEAVQYQLQAIKVAQQEKDFEHLANVRYNLGITLKSLKMYPEALNFVQQAKNYYDSTDNQRSIALCLGGMANIYGKLGDQKRSLNLYKKKYAIFQKAGIKNLANVTGNIGNAYRKLGQIDSARWYIEKSFTLRNNTKDKRKQVYYYLQSGLLDLIEKDTISAEANFLTSFNWTSKIGLLEEKQETASYLANIYTKKQEYQKAVYFQNIARTLADSLFGLDKANQLNKLLTKQTLDEYSEQIESLEVELSQRQNLLEKYQSNKIMILALSIIFILLFLWVIVQQKIQINRNKAIASEWNSKSKNTPQETLHQIVLKAENGKDQISFVLEDLMFIEANHNYVNIHLKNEVKKLRSKLKSVEKELSAYSTINRTHRAFLVNTLLIDRIIGNSQTLKIKMKESDKEIPVSRTFRPLFKTSEQKV